MNRTRIHGCAVGLRCAVGMPATPRPVLDRLVALAVWLRAEHAFLRGLPPSVEGYSRWRGDLHP